MRTKGKCRILFLCRYQIKRKLAILAVVVFMLVSCVGVFTVSNPVNVRVYNSAWEIVDEGYVASSRAVTTVHSYDDYAKAYNLAHTDDQLFVIEGEEIVPIEDSPLVDAYIADAVTHDIIKEYLGWDRSDIVTRREIWRIQAMADGGVLYVDRIPPPPVVIIDDRPAYEKWALYLVYVFDGSTKYEEHLETEEEYLSRKAIYELQVMADGGTTYLVAGELYTP